MQDDTDQIFPAGELLAGKYRVERVIGQGGMGVVLAARHEGLNTNVAIKLLRESALQHTDVLGRFLREARAAVSLRSEHVARVFDVGKLDDGRPYIVMERLEGKDLGDVIEQGPLLGVSDAVNYVLQACEAIAEAHRAGIIHRDLKPRNLFLTQAVHGRPLVKVLDFGISKVDAAPGEMQLTRTAEVIGSPSYMSPEQLRSSRSVDARTDIWALGVILYELLTRRVPFYAETVTELVLVVVTEREPPIRSFRQDVPEALEAVVAKCLMKAPEQRYQSVVELVQALEPFALGMESTLGERIRAVAGEPAYTRPMTQPLAHPSHGPPGSHPASNPVSNPASYPSNMANVGGNQGPYPGSGSGSYGQPGSPSAGSLVPPTAPSSRINVHGGTSVAWGETQTHPGGVPAVPKSGGVLPAVILTGLLVAAGVGGGAFWYVKHGPQQASPPVAAAEGVPNVPLPPGRKDLPPLPIPGAPTVPSAQQPDPPAASTLPDVRKPPAPATATPAAPTNPSRPTTPRPATPVKPNGGPSEKPDDLSNIGRR